MILAINANAAIDQVLFIDQFSTGRYHAPQPFGAQRGGKEPGRRRGDQNPGRAGAGSQFYRRAEWENAGKTAGKQGHPQRPDLAGRGDARLIRHRRDQLQPAQPHHHPGVHSIGAGLRCFPRAGAPARGHSRLGSHRRDTPRRRASGLLLPVNRAAPRAGGEGADRLRWPRGAGGAACPAGYRQNEPGRIQGHLPRPRRESQGGRPGRMDQGMPLRDAAAYRSSPLCSPAGRMACWR